MRGRISDWKDDRGFGFTEPELGGERVFFHIGGVSRGAPRPFVGALVRSFQMTFWGVVVANCGALLFSLSPAGAAMIQRLLAAW